ncbi:MAG: glycogen synthase GlgA [Paludisphaera borealis]|uniref:glycogen synthase GlgA n=1 Tax=Paludisphaera borealis TaxID=1387353 RepID=UPI002846CD16|nr:glycogen synthase GlgA [Paludisphaera borealis]MDR3622043.1 glycogen synthase GlgA [Paludisphaera borealis]
MNIVFLASEGVPFAKTGGLSDVAGALPRAVAALGHQTSLFLPCYRRVWDARPDLVGTGLTLQIPVGSQVVEGHVYESRLPGSNVPVYLIDQPSYFDREGLYQHLGKDFGDNCERFVFFQRAVLEAVLALGLRPDVFHCNDWQTGLIPVYLKTLYRRYPELASAGTLLTIHNLAYQGLFWHWDMPITGLDWSLFHHRALEFHGHLSFMKAGLVFADKLSTVSPTYAREIQTPRQGAGLDGLLRERRGDLRGIVNGIDVEAWTPRHEPMLAAPYDLETVEHGKAVNKAWLQNRAGLPVRPDVPLFAQIGRLDPQKGWDLLAETADRFLERDVQLIVLGTGHPKYHQLLEGLAKRYPDKVWAYLGFSDELAHQIEAGADVFLMPSLFEPCGLNQLYSLAHGTVPVVHATGGLVDTVVDLNPETFADGRDTGFVFNEPTASSLWATLNRVMSTWSDPPTWRQLVRRGMESDWSWSHSAREYVEIYDEIQQRLHPDASQGSVKAAAVA